MPKQKRNKTKYAGVYWIEGTAANGKPERIYYIAYRKDGRLIEEKAGRQYQDDMTPARASGLRAERIAGKGLSNKAKRELKKAREAAKKGEWTIDRLWKRYKADHNIKGIAIDEYRYEKYLKPTFGNKEPKDILALDVDRLRITMLKKKGLKPATVYNVLELFRRITNYAVKKRLCEGLNFVVEMPKVDNEKTEDLTPDQLHSLLKVIEEDTHEQAGPIMLMALYTGMRRGELFRLRWKDIDFDRGFIHIRNPKGGVDQTIPLNDGAREVLEGIYQGKNEFVFPGRGGRQRTDIHHQVNRIRDKAGLPKDFRALHGLRHVYASMLASSGKVDMYTLQKLLTHKSPQMTQRYAHLRDETLKRASNLAGKIINETVNGKASGNVVNLREQNK